MSTTLLARVQENLKAAITERDSNKRERDVRQNEIDNIVKLAEDEKRDDLNEKEALRFNEVRAQIADIDKSQTELDEKIDGLTQRVEDLQATEKARQAAEDAARSWANPAADARSVGAPARVRSEPRTYNKDAERRGVSFYRDVFNQRFNSDPAASERLERHVREARLNELSGYEVRDVGTSAFAGLTVPQYLTEMVAPVARAMRPTVEICNRHPLPADGMSVNISRITTGTGVGAQSAEGDAATETNADDTLLTVNVRTYTGMQDVSRQALDRSTGVDDILTQDLVRAYWTTLDSAILNGAGTNGTHTGIRSTSSIESVIYASGTPTAAELYPKIPELISEIQSGVFMGVSHFVMHPRRWWWITSQLSSTFPLLTVPFAGTQQSGQVGGTEYTADNRNIFGVPVVLDGNIPTTLGDGTNEDVIIGVTASELHLWHDDGPLFIRAEQPLANTLQFRYVVYSYSAFTAGRYPGAHGTIGSTGLATPSF